MRWPGIGTEEQVGPFEQGGRLGHGELAGPVSKVLVRGDFLAQFGIVWTTHDHDPPAFGEEPLQQGVPVPFWPALGGRARSQVDRQQGGLGTEPTGVQGVGFRDRAAF